jgi:hypothetical protein
MERYVMTSNYRRITLIFFLLALIAGIFPQIAAAWAVEPQSSLAIAPGTWEGYIERILTAENSAYGVSVSAKESFNGPIALQVGAGGGFSGTLGPVAIDFVYTVSTGEGGSCAGQSTFDIVGGGAATGAGGLPVLTLALQPTNTSFQCTFDIGGATFQRNTLTLQATTDSGVMLTGDTLLFDNEWLGFAVDNMREAGATVTVSEYWELVGGGPVVEVVTPGYEFVFLEGISVENAYEAIINWNDSEPGKVVFTLAGDSRETTAPEGLVTQSMDMGEPSAGTNPLEVVAYTADGAPSSPYTVDVQIAALDPWAKDASFGLQGPTGGFPSGVLYEGTAHIPPEPIKLPYADLSGIPLVGGKWGVPPIQLDVNLLATSLGGVSEEAPIEGDVSLMLGSEERSHRLEIDGGATTNLTPERLEFHQGTATFDLEDVTIKKHVGLADLVPEIRRSFDNPVYGGLLKTLDSMTRVTGRIDASLTGEAGIGPSDDLSHLTFTRGYLKPRASVSVEATPSFFKIAYAFVSGGGVATFKIQIAPDQRLEDCDVSLRFSAGVGVGDWGESFEKPWRIASCTSAALPGQRTLAALGPASGPLVMSTRPIGWEPERVTLSTSSADGVETTTLVEGVHPQSSPQMALGSDGRMAFVWGSETAGKPRSQAREITLRLFDGQTWGDPIALTDDTQLDFGPVVAFDDQGDVIVVWSRSRDTLTGDVIELTEDFVRGLEIAYAVVDAESNDIVAFEMLTDDDVMDFDPQLSVGHDGALWLAWYSSPGASLVGSADSPNVLQATQWSGAEWADTETVTGDLVGTLTWRIAAHDDKTALIIADVDTDGDLATGADREIVAFERRRGGWGDAVQLTDNVGVDMGPLVAFTSAGEPVVGWYSEEERLYGVIGNLAAEPEVWLDAEAGASPMVANGVLLAGAGGELGLLWSGPAAGGPDVWFIKRDTESGTWDEPTALLDTPEQELSLSAAIGPDGDLLLGLAQADVVRETIDLPDGGTLEIPGRPESADLVLVRAEDAFSVGATTTQSRIANAWLPLGSLAACLGCGVLVGAIAGGVILFVRARRRDTA